MPAQQNDLKRPILCSLTPELKPIITPGQKQLMQLFGFCDHKRERLNNGGQVGHRQTGKVMSPSNEGERLMEVMAVWKNTAEIKKSACTDWKQLQTGP